METLNRRCWKHLLFLLLVINSFLHAQDVPESGSFAVKTDDGFLINQIIAFPAVPDTLRYEVEVEQITGTGSVPVQKLETTENSFEVSLKAGNYRYRVTAINKMNVVEGRTGWQNFQIRPALQPEAETYQPFYGLYYEMPNPTGSITVTGRNFLPETEFALIDHKRNADWTGVSLEKQRGVVIPDQVVINENQAVLSFSRNTLKRGNYDIFIRNPGGMWTLLGEVRVGYRTDNDFTLSFGWSPVIPLFDPSNNPVYTPHGSSTLKPMLDRFNAESFFIRFAFIPVKTKFGNFGIEFEMHFLTDNEKKEKNSNHGVIGNIFTSGRFGTFNLLYQYPFYERWQHNIRFGIGWGDNYYTTVTYPYGWPDVSHNGLAIYFNLGYSVQYFFWKNLYAEAGLGLEMIRYLGQNRFMLIPAIGIGWQMGRWAEYPEVAEGAKRGKDYSVPVTDKPRPEQLISLGWAPMIPLAGIDRRGWDDSTGTATGAEFIGPINPLGLSLRYAYLPYRWGKNKLGLEFEFTMLQHKNNGELKKSVRALDLISDIMLGLRYQRVLDEKWQINFRAGAGIANAYAYHRREPLADWETPTNGPAFGFKFGASAQYFFWKDLYVEGGLDFVLAFVGAPKEDRGVSGDPRLYMKPTIAIGWQFDRNNETGLRLPGMGFPDLRKNE